MTPLKEEDAYPAQPRDAYGREKLLTERLCLYYQEDYGMAVRIVTINQLADIVADIAGPPITKNHISGPQGVRGRNSDNSRLREVLGWRPEISLEEGLGYTYAWIEAQAQKNLESLA